MSSGSPLPFPGPTPPEPTGRLLVALDPGMESRAASDIIENATGARTVDSREFGASAAADAREAFTSDRAVIISRFRVAVLPADGGIGRMNALSGAAGVRRVRPEFYMFAIGRPTGRLSVSDHAGGRALREAPLGPTAAFVDTDEFTWGLLACGADKTRFTGRGIKVAILDTGLDLTHPDFKGRQITTRSFVANEEVQDGQGHGTHCAGTVAGPREPDIGRRFGVAPEAELVIGKVLSNSGSGTEFDILLGMDWAIDEKCAVISMSLGRATRRGEEPTLTYEQVGAAALNEGSLIVAAAGNESVRSMGHIAPVGAPANSPSIMAVAALDSSLAIADFSCGGINPNGGEVDVGAPGVAVHSTFPLPQRYRTLDGTSMACPHVAGIAALWAEADPNLRGRALWRAVADGARAVALPQRDVGSGLVQVPDASVPVA
jgi:subtilisin family serine protease